MFLTAGFWVVLFLEEPDELQLLPIGHDFPNRRTYIAVAMIDYTGGYFLIITGDIHIVYYILIFI